MKSNTTQVLSSQNETLVSLILIHNIIRGWKYEVTEISDTVFYHTNKYRTRVTHRLYSLSAFTSN